MPAYNPSQLHELVQNLIPDNDNNLIEATHARQVLHAIIDSVYNLVSTPNPTAPNLANVLVEGNESGAKDLLMTLGRYLIFKDPGGHAIRIRPVQQAGPSASQKDIVLPARSGTIALLDDISGSSWLQPVADEVATPTGTESVGTRYLVAPGSTGLFAGQDGKVAQRGTDAWEFEATSNGDMVRVLTDTNGVIRSKEGGVWIVPDGPEDMNSLANVLSVGNTSGAHDVVMDLARAIAFRNGDGTKSVRLLPAAVSDDANVTLPNVTGTLALLTDLLSLRLQDILVAGNETAGRSIQISEFDGINFLQGANMVRVKAPAAATALRTLLLPDKDGTVATVDDVNAVALLVDGTMRAPEAYTPSGGLYPTTYVGDPIEKGDTFRCAAGSMGAIVVNAEDLLIALVDVPGQTDGNWQVIESNRVVATQSEAENNASTDLVKLIPPQRWWQAWTKGLTLAAFGNAVRGMLLTGYTVGSNVAVAAGDSIMGAIAKLQGQINATNTAVGSKLAKASNLSDVASVSTARNNLGLKVLAQKDMLQALVTEGYFAVGPGVAVKSIVCYDGGLDQYVLATQSMALAGASLGIAAINASGAYYIHLAGVTADIFSGLTKGSAYWLDAANPGAITATRPFAQGVYLGVAVSSTAIDFRPMPALVSGAVTLAADESGSSAGGTVSSLVAPELAPGLYRLELYARLNGATGSGASLAWFEGLTDAPNGTMMTERAPGSAWNVSASKDMRDPGTLDGGGGDEMRDLEYVLTAIVTSPGHDSPGVRFGPINDGYTSTLRAGSVLTWTRIG